MMNSILILAERSSIVRSLGGKILGAVFIALVALVIICIYRATEYFGSAKKEQKLLRIEMGKLAEEVHQIRRELKEIKDKDSPSQSQ